MRRSPPELETQVMPLQLLGYDQRRAAAGEGVEHDVAGVRAAADDPAQELLGHLAAVPAGTLFERAADTRKVPGIALGGEPVRHVLRAQIQMSSGTRPSGWARVSE